MKKSFIILTIVFLVISSFLFHSCYLETIEDLSYFTFQFPLIFHSQHLNKAAPDTSWDFVNLHKYKEYEDNKDKIQSSEFVSFNYWIDSLIFVLRNSNQGFDTLIFDKDKHKNKVEFPFIVFKIVFAKLKPGYSNPYDTDASHWDKDYSSPVFVLGTFTDVKVEEYFRCSQHILQVPEEVAKEVSKIVQNRPQFWICTEYSPLKDQDTKVEPKRYFPYVGARYDMIIRFKIKL